MSAAWLFLAGVVLLLAGFVRRWRRVGREIEELRLDHHERVAALALKRAAQRARTPGAGE